MCKLVFSFVHFLCFAAQKTLFAFYGSQLDQVFRALSDCFANLELQQQNNRMVLSFVKMYAVFVS